jgi:hypothetical protein
MVRFAGWNLKFSKRGAAMKKSTVKNMFKAIEQENAATLNAILDTEPDALETVGFHNSFVRDKTPLMYAMQCRKLGLANALVDRGADVKAIMPGGPKSSVLFICIESAYSDPIDHDKWIDLAKRLLDGGADPNSAFWTSLACFGGVVRRSDLIKILVDYGADPDRGVGDTGSTVRELVEINRRLFPEEVLMLFGLEGNDAEM